MNPELRRNLWLEITAHRLMAMPVVLGLAFIALAAIDKPKAVEHVSWMGLAGFGLLTILWGTRLAANSILDEMIDKTWDWQRLSTLVPWSMTWGKMFGATSFAWYGGLICLAVFLVTSSATDVVAPVKLAITLVAVAIALHGATIAAALHTSRKGKPVNRRSAGVLLLLVLLYAVPFLVGRGWTSKELINWYDTSFDNMNFLMSSAIVFAAWGLTGAYRAMCQGLAVRTTPLMWLVFTLFLTVFAAGFMIGGDLPKMSIVPALLISGLTWSVIFTYVMLFTEPTGPIVIRRLIRKMELKQWRRALEEIPCWPLTWYLSVICALGIALFGSFDATKVAFDWTRAPIPLVLMVARDAGILLFFSAALQPKREVGTTLVYMLMLDWILPGLLTAMDFKLLAQLVLPLGQGSTGMQIVIAFIQAVIALTLAWRRLQQNFSEYRRADGA